MCHIYCELEDWEKVSLTGILYRELQPNKTKDDYVRINIYIP